jgi:hypothetical protein
MKGPMNCNSKELIYDIATLKARPVHKKHCVFGDATAQGLGRKGWGGAPNSPYLGTALTSAPHGDE